MKISTALAALMVAGGMGVQAQTNLPPSTNSISGTSNLLQNLNLALVYYTEGPSNNINTNSTTFTAQRVRVTTRDVIASLGRATGTNFARNARLVVVNELTSSNGSPTIEVSSGGSLFDVSSFFTLNPEDSNTVVVQNTKMNNSTGLPNGKEYSILDIGFTNLDLSLNASGFAISSLSSFKKDGVVYPVMNTRAFVAGSGVLTNQSPAVVQGTVTISGRTLSATEVSTNTPTGTNQLATTTGPTTVAGSTPGTPITPGTGNGPRGNGTIGNTNTNLTVITPPVNQRPTTGRTPPAP